MTASTMTTFHELGVHDEILKGLAELGFTTPTPIQEKVIPALLGRRRDQISLAQTGTGKTAAFGIPLVQLANTGNRRPQGLVLCPTRELCMQVARDLANFAKHRAGLAIVAVYGGAPIDRQIRSLRQGAQLVVATPGRLADLMQRREIDLSALAAVVLDEADEMLNMGFRDEIDLILAATPESRTTLLFSATMSEQLRGIAARYMREPEEVLVGRRNGGADNVEHVCHTVRATDRYPALRRIVDASPGIFGIVFCRTRQETQEVADRLTRDGHAAEALHGDLSQAQRDQVMTRFRNGVLRLLVATDVAARGVDVSELSHVINYNLPDDPASYTHRSGRTGRAGRSGTSVVIALQRDQRRVRELEQKIGKRFAYRPLPSGREVCEARLQDFAETFAALEVDESRLEHFLPGLSARLADLDREELLKRILKLQCGAVLEAYHGAPDLNPPAAKGAKAGDQAEEARNNRKKAGSRFTRFFVNVGRGDGMLPERLIGMVNEGTGIRGIAIGKIELQRNFSFIEADSRFTAQIMEAFRHYQVNGKPVKAEVAESVARPAYLDGPGAQRWKPAARKPRANSRPKHPNQKYSGRGARI